MNQTQNQVSEDGADKTAPLEARIVSDTPRSTVEPIEWHVDFDGKTWTEIEISRCSGDEVEEYLDKIQSGDSAILPCIRCPIEVWKKMDDDDRYRIEKVADNGFFPQRLKAMAEHLQQISENSSE